MCFTEGLPVYSFMWSCSVKKFQTSAVGLQFFFLSALCYSALDRGLVGLIGFKTVL